MKRFTLAALLAASLASAPPALAGPSQSTSPAPGGYVTACATQISGGGTPVPGTDLVNEYAFYVGLFACSSQAFAGAGSAAATAQWSAPNIANTGAGQAKLGAVQLQSTNTSPSDVQTPEGAATGGWKDVSTVTLAGHQGEAAIWLVSVHTGGLLTASGRGAASLTVNAFKNNSELGNSVPGWDNGSESDNFTTSAQRAAWVWGTDAYSTRSIDDLVTFAVPVTIGTAFSWGVYGITESGMASWGPGYPHTTTASSDMHFEFVGSSLMVGNTAFSEFAVGSTSGVDWHAAAVPEPANVALLSGGLALLGVWMRRRRLGAIG